MTSRFRLILFVGSASIALAGCSDDFNAGPILYKDHDRVAADLKGKPNLLEAVRKALADRFGPTPREIRAPEGSGLPEGGRRLANYENLGDGKLQPIRYRDDKTGEAVAVSGGYGLYRKYCLHCHGVQGGGDGPTAPFLYPRPRDYRPGIFKFTSVAPSNPKPTRADLRKTLLHGLHGTSMPAFEALMTAPEIEQVIDYVIFLSMRGEVEKFLLDEAKNADKDDPAALPADLVKDITDGVLNNWKQVEGQVVAPKARRLASNRESILRGRHIFLGLEFSGPGGTRNKTECTSCHGNQAVGNGTSFIDKRVFDKVVFRGVSIEDAIRERYREVIDEQRSVARTEAIRHGSTGHGEESTPPSEDFDAFKNRLMTAWKPGSIDDWGNPLRPANLNLGVYKGGRRPIDLYWRIAKGINGAKMPSHANLMTDEQIWDVVNFVLALPYEPELLKDADRLKAGGAAPTSTAALAPR